MYRKYLNKIYRPYQYISSYEKLDWEKIKACWVCLWECKTINLFRNTVLKSLSLIGHLFVTLTTMYLLWYLSQYNSIHLKRESHSTNVSTIHIILKCCVINTFTVPSLYRSQSRRLGHSSCGVYSLAFINKCWDCAYLVFILFFIVFSINTCFNFYLCICWCIHLEVTYFFVYLEIYTCVYTHMHKCVYFQIYLDIIFQSGISCIQGTSKDISQHKMGASLLNGIIHSPGLAMFNSVSCTRIFFLATYFGVQKSLWCQTHFFHAPHTCQRGLRHVVSQVFLL